MGTVLIQRWSMRCRLCKWHRNSVMFGANLGTIDVSRIIRKLHKQEASECEQNDYPHRGMGGAIQMKQEEVEA